MILAYWFLTTLWSLLQLGALYCVDKLFDARPPGDAWVHFAFLMLYNAGCMVCLNLPHTRELRVQK